MSPHTPWVPLFALAAMAPAQMAWTQPTTATAPLLRAGHAMAFDAARARVVLFGGNNPAFAYYGDTWEWDGAQWSQRATTGPAPRTATALAFDPVRARVVLFGGADGSAAFQPYQDTWEWDGVAWSLRSPAVRPSARYYHALAWDAANAQVLLFGGQLAGNDTWEWDGNAWTQRAPTASPNARAGLAMAGDTARARVVMYGGRVGTIGSNYPTDTWEWDGAQWLQRATTTAPSGRANVAMAFDAGRRRVVLYGGLVGGNVAADTWEWDGTAWTQRTPTGAPTARYVHAMAYDAARLCTVLFGGNGPSTQLADTRLYAPVTPPLAAPFGNGCSGSAGTPSLDCTALAWTGGTYHQALGNAPAFGAAAFSIGLSDTLTGAGLPLPLSLASIGVPCTLLVDPAVLTFVTATAGGTAARDLAIPAVAAFAGVTLYAQAFTFDAGAPGGLAATNGCQHTIGGT